MSINNNNQVDIIINQIISNGIQIDKNLRQPSFYSLVTFQELKTECFSIISDLLINQNVPLWLSQKIAWFYSSKFFQDIVSDLSITQSDSKSFKREKIVLYLRNSISSILKEWTNFNNNNNSNKISSCKKPIYYEYGLKNKRRTMEDKASIYENIDLLQTSYLTNSITKQEDDDDEDDEDLNSISKKKNSLFAVFDGHCGIDCAQYVSTHLPLSLIQNYELTEKLNNDLALDKLFRECFQIVNENFTLKAIEESIRSGTTACVALLSSSSKKKEKYTKLNLAWCGDTQFCLVKNGKIHYISPAHKPENEPERARIASLGGTVAYIANTWRVNGSLAVARSFGDIDYQSSGVCCDPETKSFDLDGTEDYFIIGCDGLWETLDLNSLCKFVYENKDSGSNIAELLVRQAKENGSTDNISAIFVLLKESLDLISKP